MNNETIKQSNMIIIGKSVEKMKKQIVTITLIISLLFPLSLFSQDVPPPPPGGGHGQTGNQQGGRAPIGGGLLILLGLGGIYGGYKAYKIYRKKSKSLLD